MVGPSGNNPLNLPPTKEIKKVEIRKIVEGFDISDSISDSIADNAQIMPDSNEGGHGGYHGGGETDLHLAHTEDYEEKFSKRKRH